MTNERHIAERVRELVEPLVTHAGMELVDVEYGRGPGGMVLRLTIDKPGGVTVDDCAGISRVAGDLLDVKDPIPGNYNLEVSSPGINRPLKQERDYNRFAGNRVILQTREPIEGRRKFTGMLEGIKKGFVRISSNGATHEIPFDQITKARLDIL